MNTSGRISNEEKPAELVLRSCEILGIEITVGDEAKAIERLFGGSDW